MPVTLISWVWPPETSRATNRLYRLEIWIWNNISEDYEIISEDYEIISEDYENISEGYKQ